MRVTIAERHPHAGSKNGMFGRKRTEEELRKISLGTKLAMQRMSEESRQTFEASCRRRWGKPSWNSGKTGVYSEATLRLIGQASIGRTAGEKHWNWRGGICRLPYALEFNDQFKEYIRIRDGYICQECGISQSALPCPLDIHHIDYDKLNTDDKNAISLCKQCHGKTNYSRMYWQRHFEEKIAKIYASKGGD